MVYHRSYFISISVTGTLVRTNSQLELQPGYRIGLPHDKTPRIKHYLQNNLIFKCGKNSRDMLHFTEILSDNVLLFVA